MEYSIYSLLCWCQALENPRSNMPQTGSTENPIYEETQYIEDIRRLRGDMDFMFKWQKLYLTNERSERVRYCF